MERDGIESSYPELEAETDADLLVYMSMAADDPPLARAAWGELYRRHVGYLYAVCFRAYGDLLGGAEGAADVAADTFRRAYERASTFDAGGITDPDRLRLRVRAWLGRIAERLVQSALRGRRVLPVHSLAAEDIERFAAPPAGAEDDEDDERVETIRSALATLSERERLVIRATLQWYQPGSAHQRLPNQVAAELAETLRTTPENLRQIRRRAFQKLRALLGGAMSDADVRRGEL